MRTFLTLLLIKHCTGARASARPHVPDGPTMVQLVALQQSFLSGWFHEPSELRTLMIFSYH